jgi:hypothetical protein
MGYIRIIFGSSSVIDTAGAKIDDFVVEYLRKFASICKMAFPVNQGPRWDCFMKKSKVKNLVTLSL